LQEIYQSSNQEMFANSLSSCSRYNANFKLDQSQCSLFMTVRHIFEISEDDHPRTVTHARDIWWTLDFANAFVSPGVNSRGELVPSHGVLVLFIRVLVFSTLRAVGSGTRNPQFCCLQSRAPCFSITCRRRNYIVFSSELSARPNTCFTELDTMHSVITNNHSEFLTEC
jgi:hypothetical protein